MDGRDTPPESGIDFLRALEQKMREYGVGQIASVSGRYYAMDRDNRWERIELAYRAVVHGEAETHSSDPVAALQKSYEQGVTDEFVKPIVITKGNGAASSPVAAIHDDDAVIFFNFRADRARQMTRALIEPGFDKIADAKRPKNLFYVAMTQYDKNWPWLKYVIAPEKLESSKSCSTKTCVARKPKSTPTSPISSTAASKSRLAAKSAFSYPRRKLQPTT
jgi:2,3-bisphosphoglycerate-independent phosphoglycerate mutase